MAKLHYLTYENVIVIHEAILSVFSGLPGIKSENHLDSLLHHIQNDVYYPSIFEKSAHLFFGLIQFHIFNDGNKRTAVLALYSFFLLNKIIIDDMIIKMEDIAVGTAKGEIGEDELIKIFRSMFLSFGYNIDKY